MAEAAEPGPDRLWIRDPRAVLAEGAGGGIVVAGTRIVEYVSSEPSPPEVSGSSLEQPLATMAIAPMSTTASRMRLVRIVRTFRRPRS